MSVGRNLMILAGVVVAATLALSVTVMDSPATQRGKRLDQRRVDDLKTIVQVIDVWALEHNALPGSLDLLADQPGRSLSIHDPDAQAAYEYIRRSGNTYALCAVFATTTSDPDGWRRNRTRGQVDEQWRHPAGRFCFEQKAYLPPAAVAPARTASED